MAGDILQRQSFRVGEVIFSTGEPPRCAYLIQSGRVDIVIEQGETKKTVSTLEAGDMLGEMALIDKQPRSASAVAREPATCIVITPQDFQRRLEKSDAFVRAIVKVLTQRLRKMTGD